ncbi:MAG: Ig-like domain-containing protein [Bacteroidales bacterium]|nr:Ig-like domain-containing protein [Bacteroidales bacterium]
MNTKKSNSETLLARLSAYSASAAALLSLSQSADAQIVYSSKQDIILNSGNKLEKINVDGDTKDDFVFSFYTSGFIYMVNSNTNNKALGDGHGHWCTALDSDYNVHKFRTNWSGNIFLASTTLGDFHGNGEKFIGVKFDIDENVHFGWFRVEIPQNGTELKIVDWAYNATPDSAIITGHQKPKVKVVSGLTRVNGEFDVEFNFDTKVNFYANDINNINCNILPGSLKSDDGIHYEAKFTTDGNGDVIIGVDAGEVEQSVTGELNEASNVLNLVYDNKAPGVNVSILSTNNRDSIEAQFVFTEEVADFDASKINVINGELVNGSFKAASALVYTAQIKPLSTGNVSIRINSGEVHDLAGNENVAAHNIETTVDLSEPKVTIASDKDDVNGVFEITITCSEKVNGFSEDSISVVNGSVVKGSLSSTGNIVFTASIDPDTDGDVVISIDEAQFTDTVGNKNQVSNSLVVKADMLKPDVVITQDIPGTVNGVFDVTVTFSEEIKLFFENEISVDNGFVKSGTFNSSDSKTFKFSIVPESTGDVTVGVAEGAAQDDAGNPNLAATSLVVNADIDAPTVKLKAHASLVNSSFEVTFDFSEDVVGFTKEDITVENGTAGLITAISAKQYKVIITPGNTGVVGVSIGAGKVEDLGGIKNIESRVLEVDYDPTSLRESFASNNINIFPNPASSEVTIGIDDYHGLLNVVMVDISGKIVLKADVENRETIDVSSLKTGSYILKIHTLNEDRMASSFVVL